jgi:hypothetical protein
MSNNSLLDINQPLLFSEDDNAKAAPKYADPANLLLALRFSVRTTLSCQRKQQIGWVSVKNCIWGCSWGYFLERTLLSHFIPDVWRFSSTPAASTNSNDLISYFTRLKSGCRKNLSLSQMDSRNLTW